MLAMLVTRVNAFFSLLLGFPVDNPHHLSYHSPLDAPL